MEKSKVLELLHENIVDIEFIKKDGTVRHMTCTLRPSSLPAQIDVEEHVQKKTPNANTLAVFDTINQGWRSFNWSSLMRVNGQLYEWEPIVNKEEILAE
jgi:hypothetical protein